MLDIPCIVRYNELTNKEERQTKQTKRLQATIRKEGTDHRTQKVIPQATLMKGGTVQRTRNRIRFFLQPDTTA